MKNILFCCFVFLSFIFFDLQTNSANADDKDIYQKNCIDLCGEGYHYDRPGNKRNGQELVCTKYPLPCGYSCTTGWRFRYLVDDTNYTCQEAIQVDPSQEPSKN